MAKKTTLGWGKAWTHAETIVQEGELTRKQHLRVFKKYYESRKQQDHRIALALLGLFIQAYEADFDLDVDLDVLIEHGNKLCENHWKEFGRKILYQVLKVRSVPAVWVDKIADEETIQLRHAFAFAIAELAKRKRNPLDRVLGLAKYFIDDPSPNVREAMVETLRVVGERDSQRLHYFLVDFEKGAGSNRLALINDVRSTMGWE